MKNLFIGLTGLYSPFHSIISLDSLHGFIVHVEILMQTRHFFEEVYRELRKISLGQSSVCLLCFLASCLLRARRLLRHEALAEMK